MGIIDYLIPKARKWQNITKKAQDLILRAAQVQAQKRNIDPFKEAIHLSDIYNVKWKNKDWREYGDIAFHIIASYPPDLGYIIIYGFRKLKSKIGYDPVPFILKAIEMIYHLRPWKLNLHIEVDERCKKLFDSPEERAKAGAKIIAREISITPLRHASGIYKIMEPNMKLFVKEELKVFNPEAYKIWVKGSRLYLLTKEGILRWITNFLFGRER